MSKRKGKSKKVHVVGGDLGHKMKGHKAKARKGGRKRTTRKK